VPAPGVLVEIERRQHDDPRRPRGGDQPRQRLEAVEVRHAHVAVTLAAATWLAEPAVEAAPAAA
jgi:hypothetical protein